MFIHTHIYLQFLILSLVLVKYGTLYEGVFRKFIGKITQYENTMLGSQKLHQNFSFPWSHQGALIYPGKWSVFSSSPEEPKKLNIINKEGVSLGFLTDGITFRLLKPWALPRTHCFHIIAAPSKPALSWSRLTLVDQTHLNYVFINIPKFLLHWLLGTRSSSLINSLNKICWST